MSEGEKSWPQIFAILSACFLSLVGGWCFGWSSPSTHILLKSKEYTIVQLSYFNVIQGLSLSAFAYPYSLFALKVGRKPSILTIVIFQACALICQIIGGNIWVYYLSRLFAGVSDSGIFCVIPIFIGEISSPKVRGIWGNLISVNSCFGMFLVNLIGSYFSIRWTAVFAFPLLGMFVLTFPWVPETPYYYVMKGKINEAEKSLRWYKRKEDVSAEMEIIKDVIASNQARNYVFRDICRIKPFRRAAFVLIALRYTQQLSGATACLANSHYIFSLSGGSLEPRTAAIITSSVLVVTVIVAAALTEKWGRKVSVLTSGIACEFFLITLGIFVYLKTQTKVNTDSFLWYPVCGMMCFLLMYSLGLLVIPNLMLTELFPSQIKAKAMGLMNITFGIFLAFSNKMLPDISHYLGLHYAFWFFAIAAFIGIVVCAIIVPETRGKTLEQIQTELENKFTLPGH